jgi:hypothetical protein
MALLVQGSQNRYTLPPGDTLSVATDANSSCRYAQLPNAPSVSDVPSGGMIAVGASTTVVIGPRADVSRWLIESVAGPGVNVTQNPAQGLVVSGASADWLHLAGAGAPAASLGANHAATGSLYIDQTNGKAYINSGSKSSPSWRLITSA